MSQLSVTLDARGDRLDVGFGDEIVVLRGLVAEDIQELVDSHILI